MRKWYVFDKFDCFGQFATIAEAAKQAEWLANTVDDNDYEGVHIAYMSTEEFGGYCYSGKFPFAK